MPWGQCRFSHSWKLALMSNGPLIRYPKLRFAHAPGMPGTFSPQRLQRQSLASDPGMHHGTFVTHVSWCTSGSLIRGGGENVPGIPGASATRNIAYLVRVPLHSVIIIHVLISNYFHYNDVIITSLIIVYSTVYSGADQRQLQSSASLAFVWGTHRGPVNSPHK